MNELDQIRIRFEGKVLSACFRKNASLDTEESVAPFLESLYQEFMKLGMSLEECPRWLDERLANVFLSMDAPPVWIEEEPNWPFMDGHPMVFISQTKIDDSDFSRTHLSPGTVLYLFGSRCTVVENDIEGFEMKYRVICQYPEFSSSDG